MHPQPKFSQKTIYNLWSEHNSKKRKRDEDEVKSAKLLINEASSQHGHENGSSGLYTVMPVPLHDEPGFVAIAFVLQEVLRQWGVESERYLWTLLVRFSDFLQCYSKF
jgi:hypothetical protein